jgi:hypothetical protein
MVNRASPYLMIQESLTAIRELYPEKLIPSSPTTGRLQTARIPNNVGKSGQTGRCIKLLFDRFQSAHLC